MDKNFKHLAALLAGAQNKSAPVVEASIVETIEWLTPLEESNDPAAHMLALEGYNYFTNVQDSTLGEKLIDWLEENQVEYLTNGAGQFQIKCADREGAYRLSGAITKIMDSRPVVRDSAMEEIVSEKKNKGNADAVKARNPIAIAMQKRGGDGAHNSKDPRRKDSYDRRAKHKGRRGFDEALDYSVGDAVIVGETEATVKIPNGPNGTIGVVMDGVLTMVNAADVSRLDEQVLGFSQVNPIYRLRELAGLPPAPAAPAPTPPAQGTDFDDVGGDDLDGFGDDMGDDMGSDDLGLPGDDMAGDASMDTLEPDAGLGGDDLGGVPGDLPPMGMGANVAPAPTNPLPPQSEAFAEINDSLNTIQTLLGDVKLSEYKMLVQKLEDLANQVRGMGRDYLGERRMKK